jgi:hypothetical protein
VRGGLTTAFDLSVFGAVLLMAVALIGVKGEFPLNDDWSFALTVRHFLASGAFRPNDWGAMTLLTNVVWGAAFCIPTGFSFTALRVSTLAASMATIVAAYLLILHATENRRAAVVGTATLMVNPIFAALSFTFMTDVPFTALFVLSVLFFCRALTGRFLWNLALATLFSLASVLSRQIGLCAPLAFMVVVLFTQRKPRLRPVGAVVSFLICFLGLEAFQWWMQHSGRLPGNYNIAAERLQKVLSSPPTALFNAICLGTPTALYLGLFLLPVVLLAAWPILRASRWRAYQTLALTVMVLGLFSIAINIVGGSLLMPELGNVLAPYGIGPRLLRDTSILHLPHLPSIGIGFWIIVTALAYVGTGLLAVVLFRGVAWIRHPIVALRSHAPQHVFIAACAAVYVLPLLLTGTYDRYLIPLLPLLAALILTSAVVDSNAVRSPEASKPSLCLLAAFGVFSLFATADYLAWNRLRLRAVQELVAETGLSVKDIDAGFELNGFASYDPHYLPPAGRSWWWAKGDAFEISSGPISGYAAIRQYPFHSWLPPYNSSIFVLRRSAPP